MTKLTLQEILRDLRYPNKLEDISEATGISVATLSRFESDDTKDIPYQSLLKLATHYDVSMDYLCGLTTLKKYEKTEVSELYLTTEVIELLKNKKVNNRILCELLTNQDYIKLISAIEVYLDRSLSEGVINANITFDFLYDTLSQQVDLNHSDEVFSFLKETSVAENEYLRFKISERFNVLLVNLLDNYKSRFKVNKTEKEELAKLNETLSVYQKHKEAEKSVAKAKLRVLASQIVLDITELSQEELEVMMKALNKAEILKKSRGGERKKA